MTQDTASVSVRDLHLAFGAVEVLKGLDVETAPGEFLVLLGPSGCGKSTLLNCIAGLLEITDGQIWIKGKNVTWEEPKDRGIGMVFQSYALYPQMSVRGNLAFGLKNQRMPKAQIEERIARAARILQIEDYLDRKPAALSGGQRQRVAIGRALVRDVDVFLFDEPLSNLDAKLRAELRVELKRLHAQLENTMIYVTHDQIEALTLADRIAVMRGGVIQQLDTPLTIYNRPANLFVAGFIGSPAMSMLSGRVEGGRFHVGAQSLDLGGYDGEVSARLDPAILGLRPEHVEIVEGQGGPGGLLATVDIDEPMGADSLLWLDVEGQKMSARIPVERSLRRGTEVRVVPVMDKASLFDAESEQRI
ncbi:ABC transporter ATP-binding protein [uncultured Jannaschia sp.]|uniref:ABC transporter ATP-binding protein n=1 Tax=uncultured Jannaschia sp. TaxID=293347 RepID=UPI0026355A63|nr:sn-glycerol-3-phosphate ABC transporter ATP-binding protein UgpC [uncultured Jannaschia sp.]